MPGCASTRQDLASRTSAPRLATGKSLAPDSRPAHARRHCRPHGPIRLSLSAAKTRPRLAAHQPAAATIGRIFSVANVVHLGFGLLKVAAHCAPSPAGACGASASRLMTSADQLVRRNRRVPAHGPALDQPANRRRPAGAGPVRLRLSVLEARARPADDHAGAEGRSQNRSKAIRKSPPAASKCSGKWSCAA